jgi:signal transduction histidine kinase
MPQKLLKEVKNVHPIWILTNLSCYDFHDGGRLGTQPVIHAIGQFWQKLTLAQQFALASLIVILPGSLGIAWWIPQRINDAVIKNAAAGTALYMESLMVPLIPQLQDNKKLSEETRSGLDSLLKRARQDGKLVSIKIWQLDGTVAYSSFADVIGKKFEPSASFLIAREGGLGVSYDELAHEEDKNEQAAGIPLLEVYAPVRNPDTRQVVALSEFYADGSTLGRDIARATRLSWLVVGLAASALIGVLSFIVSKASELITSQRQKLEHQVGELQNLLAQNESLRDNLRRANEDVSHVNEQVLERVGADLHDGPAQLLTFVMLRMSRLKKLVSSDATAEGAVSEMAGIISDALRAIRNLSTGLMLPELASLGFVQVLEKAVKLHKDYTNSEVSLTVDLDRDVENQALKTCAFRFVQEALTNSFKHAGGRGQAVHVAWRRGLQIAVSDTGPGMNTTVGGQGLGLLGMRSRIEAQSGTLDVILPVSGGVRLVAHFPEKLEILDRRKNWKQK